MNQFYIVMSGGLFGHFGKAATLREARHNWKKAGGRKSEGGYREEQFISKLPFAPFDREATTEEADAWVGQDGSLCWIRCDRITLEEPVRK